MVVCVARAAAVLPLMSALEHFIRIPPVGWRNEAVLIWGGVALALSLPESFPQRETFVAMTGGVVLATLLLNATTISSLVHRLGLDRPSPAERFLSGFAVISAVERSRGRLKELGFEDPEVLSRLSSIEADTWKELEDLELSEEEEITVLLRRGLSTERETYQHLRDAGVITPHTVRILLHEVGGQMEASDLGQITMEEMESTRGQRSSTDRLIHRLSELLPQPTPANQAEQAYDEAGAWRLGARRAREDLDEFQELPNMNVSVLREAQETFGRWEREALDSLSELDAGPNDESSKLRHRRAEALSSLSATDALQKLVAKGLLPEELADHAAGEIRTKIKED